MDLSVKHLQRDRRTGILRYRRVFPVELRPFIATATGKPRTELKVSLGARDIDSPGATERYRAAKRRYRELVAHARKAADGQYDELTAPMIAHLVAQYRAMELGDDAAGRFEPGVQQRGRLVTDLMDRGGMALEPHRPAARWTLGPKLAHRTALEAYRAFAADGDLEGIMDAWSGPADRLAASNGLNVDKAASSFRELCIALNDGAIEVHAAILQRFEGVAVPTPEHPAPLVPAASKPCEPEKTLRTIFLELIDRPRHGHKEPTKERTRGALRFLEEALGPVRPSELTRSMVTEWLDLMGKRPARNPKGAKGLTIRQVVERFGDDPSPRLAQKTVEAHNIALNARWKEAQADGDIPKALPSPFADRKFRRAAGRVRTAKGFTADELTAYFSLPVFTQGVRPIRGKGEAVYWLPLLLLFTGARPEEVSQLLVSDISQRESDGKWLIRFTDEGEHPIKGQQSLKTERSESGRRTFPLAQALIDLGLPAYLEQLQVAGETALFPLLRLKGRRSGIYASFGEWFCEYIYANGILDRAAGRQPVREFRHTWTTAARASRIPREAQEYIQGHRAPGGGSAHEGYGEREDLGQWIEQLVLPVDVTAIVKPWKLRA